MLGYFETKNIGRKRERAAAFHEMGDATSETDMEFDWADETLHAEYGRRWLRRLLEARGEDPESWPAVLERCEQLVQERVARATPEDLERIRACADDLIDAAETRAGLVTFDTQSLRPGLRRLRDGASTGARPVTARGLVLDAIGDPPRCTS